MRTEKMDLVAKIRRGQPAACAGKLLRAEGTLGLIRAAFAERRLEGLGAEVALTHYGRTWARLVSGGPSLAEVAEARQILAGLRGSRATPKAARAALDTVEALLAGQGPGEAQS